MRQNGSMLGKRSYLSNKEQVPCVFSLENVVISFYLFVMLGFFPLFFKYQYAGMGDSKYTIFRYSSVLCVGILFLLLLISSFGKIVKKGFPSWIQSLNLQFSILDKAILFYFICTTVSTLFSAFKEEVLWGAPDWNMGYITQFLLVALYFGISRKWKYQSWQIGLLLITSGIVFTGGILHRFDVDFLHIYGDLELKYKIQFLSTIGQSSWYSSFLCTVFPLGLYLFFISEQKILRILTGIYSVLAMCTLVTQNTDSAFLCLFAVLVFLFYLSFDGEKERRHFYEVLLLVFGSFSLMGLCQRIFADRMIPLDSLSVFLSQSLIAPCMFLLTGMIYLWCKNRQTFFFAKNKFRKNRYEKSTSIPDRKSFWVMMGILVAVILAMLLFIVWNSNGFLYTHFGYQNVNNYLFFTDNWGNARGFAWRYTCEMFSELPFVQKWIGVGPDCYASYTKSVPAYAQQMADFWGNLVLTNAHNEYLTKLVNVGIFGLVSYLFMLVSAISLFVKKRKEHVLLPGFAMCVATYMAHNVFCYEQVCCTPFFYILMGIGSNLFHNKQQKSTY